jgi:hypothetical protein
LARRSRGLGDVYKRQDVNYGNMRTFSDDFYYLA